MGRWAPVLLLSVAIPAAAPWFEIARRLVRDRLGEGYLDLLAAGLALAGIGAFAGAVATIRDRRWVRYGLLAVALGLVGGQVLLWSGAQREVVLVERVHLVEYGGLAFLYVRVLRHRMRDVALPVAALLATSLVGLADEWVQWASPVRTGELGDVLLNVWAGAIGVLFGLALAPPERLTWRPAPGSLRVLRGLGTAVLLVLGVVFEFAGHGVVIRDPVAGSFLSFHRPDQLLEAARDRATRWAAEPPGPLRPLELEDYFRTEAGSHVQWRNRALDAGRMRQAWIENRILERWYDPFLDLGRHRWSPGERRRVAQSTATGPSPAYRSPVFRQRLHTVPRSLWWGGILTAIVAVQLAVRPLGRRVGDPSDW